MTIFNCGNHMLNNSNRLHSHKKLKSRNKKIELRRDVQKTIEVYLKKLEIFIDDYQLSNSYLKCIFINGYNHFYSGYVLGKKGLRCQSLNCLRFGLECVWLGIYLQKHPLLALEWAFGTGDKDALNHIKELEKPVTLRKRMGEEGRLKIEDRNDIYKALSDKSHTKMASIAILTMNYSTECIPVGGLKGNFNVTKVIQAVRIVLEFALAEIEDYLEHSFFEDEWKYNRLDIIHISQGAYGDKDKITDPHISSQNHPGNDGINAAALLETIRKGHL